MKFSSAGDLIYSPYLGGSDDDFALGLAIDNNGDVIITGYTRSTNFSITTGAFNKTYSGNANIFVSKFSENTGDLLNSTLIAGGGIDYGYSVLADSENNIWIGGYSLSLNYPTTTGAYNQTLSGNWDIIISKLSSSLDTLLNSTYIGGTDLDALNSMTLDVDGNIWATGITESNDFPTTAGAYNQTFGGVSDGFLIKLSNNADNLLISTYIGGSSFDNLHNLDIDTDGNIWVTGESQSDNYPITDTLHNVDGTLTLKDIVLSKLSANGEDLLYSTYLGGSAADEGHALALDFEDNIWIVGQTSSPDFLTTPDAFERDIQSTDGFVLKLSATGDQLLYATLLGGTSINNAVYTIVINAHGDIWISGSTTSVDFPTTTGAYEENDQTGLDLFLTSFLRTTAPDAPIGLSAPASVDANENVTLLWTAPTFTGNQDITNYRIYRGTTSGTYELLTEIDASNTNYVDTNATIDQVNYYVITAINSVGESIVSNEVSVAIGDATVPTGTGVQTTTATITVGSAGGEIIDLLGTPVEQNSAIIGLIAGAGGIIALIVVLKVFRRGG